MNIHDDRSVPLDLEPLTKKDAAWAKLWRRLCYRENNARDERAAKAKQDNAPLRAAEADRFARQPGNQDRIAMDALRVVGRAGSGPNHRGTA